MEKVFGGVQSEMSCQRHKLLEEIERVNPTGSEVEKSLEAVG